MKQIWLLGHIIHAMDRHNLKDFACAIHFQSLPRPFSRFLLRFRVVALVAPVRWYGGAVLTLLTMCYLVTRMAMAVAAWLSVILALSHPHQATLLLANAQQHNSHRSSSGYPSLHNSATNVFDTEGPRYTPTLAQEGEDGATFGSSRCPPRCACFGDTVDCARRGLTRMPTGVPPDTQRLWVDKGVLLRMPSEIINRLTYPSTVNHWNYSQNCRRTNLVCCLS